jgi:hypothetical protein
VVLVNAVAALLRSEPQPPGDGAVFRHLRALLGTGHYRRSDSLATGGVPGLAKPNGRSFAKATGQSTLCRGAAIK